VKALNEFEVIRSNTQESSSGASLPQPGKNVETEAIEMIDKADQIPDPRCFINQSRARR
jgi:hypothetical protein